jgi:hypothetical protein
MVRNSLKAIQAQSYIMIRKYERLCKALMHPYYLFLASTENYIGYAGSKNNLDLFSYLHNQHQHGRALLLE